MTCDYLTARSQTRERHLALAPGHPGTGQTAAAGPSPAGPPAAGPTSRAAAAGSSPAGPSPAGLTSRRLPGWLGLALICCGAAMLPWLAVLAVWVPATTTVTHWSTAWIGLDAAEGAGLLLTGWLLRRGDPRHGLAAMVTATALAIDAWFDVTTSAPGSGLAIAVLMAVCAELPVAALCTVLALRAVTGPRGVQPARGPARLSQPATRRYDEAFSTCRGGTRCRG